MPTTLRFLFLLLLGLLGLQPVAYSYAAINFVSSTEQCTYVPTTHSQASSAETAASVPLCLDRDRAGSASQANLRPTANFIAAESGATLRLPASMADELPAYQQAADNGLLTKIRSSDLPGSNARAIWQEANGPVPDGFDVDHIIQRQFGGTDDLSNLQLKLSGLNRSQGAQSMWLNKASPYGTVFDSVELTGH